MPTYTPNAMRAAERIVPYVNDAAKFGFAGKAVHEQVATIISECTGDKRLREVLETTIKALEALVPVAQNFERQASAGSGGRRGYVVFNKAEAALEKARAALKATEE